MVTKSILTILSIAFVLFLSANSYAAQTSATKYFDDRKAAMVLTFDTELYMAAIHNMSYGPNSAVATAGAQNVLNAWPNIIADCETYGIPVSFCICGHNAVFGDKGLSEVNEIDIYQPWHSDSWWTTHTWYSDMPQNGGNYQTVGDLDGTSQSYSLIYGGPLTERTINSSVPFEISYHTFGHESLANITSDNMDAVFRLGVAYHKRMGIKLTSVAPPWNRNPQPDNYPVFVQNGIFVFSNYEGVMGEPYEAIDNLWIVPRSGTFYPDSDLTGDIDTAIAGQMVLSPFSHPDDGFFSSSRDGFQKTLAYAKSKVTSGDLWATTLSEIGRYWEAKSNVNTVTSVLDSNSIVVAITLKNYDTQRFGIPYLTFVTTMPNVAAYAKVTVDYPSIQTLDSTAVRVVDANVIYTVYLNPVGTTTVQITGVTTPYTSGIAINKPVLAIDSIVPTHSVAGQPITITATANSTDATYSVNMIYQHNNDAKDSKVMTYNSVAGVWQTTVGPFDGGHVSYYVSVTDNSGRRERSNLKSIVLSPIISGTVGLVGVIMNGLPTASVTASDGSYIASVPYGWNGTVTPAKTGCTFAPASRSYGTVMSDQSGQSYTATQSSLGWSDDFSGSEPNLAVWTFINPRSDGWLSMGSDTLTIHVPGGTNHDIWIPNDAPRLMLNIPNTDFTIQTKFNSDVTLTYQMEGLLAQQDSSNYIRFDVFSESSNVRLYSAHFVNGTANVTLNKVISRGAPYYLRIARQGDLWTMDYSYNGTQWNTGTSFTRAITINSVGLCGGNYASNNNAPAFAAVADYFWSSISPILPSEPNQYSVAVTTIGHGSVIKNPDKTAYSAGETVTLTAIPYTDATFSGWSGAVQGTNNPATLIITGNHLVTATFTSTSSTSQVNVWYGDYQIFGEKGIPQRWINILGNVTNADNIASLKYSLNGGTLLPLSIGLQNPRLVSRGDFNVEIACTDLLTDANNIVQIVATDNADAITTKTVICKYIDTNIWPLPYTANWSSATAVTDVAQIVDGQWTSGSNGVSTVVQGYDRLIAIGDMDYWHDYEVTVPITVHRSYHDIGQTGNEPAIGLGIRWDGHTQWGSDQPSLGYYPVGAFVFFRWFNATSGEYRIYNHDYQIIAQNSSPGLPQDGITYMYKVRVETIAGVGGLYSFKVWQSGQSEPSAWLMTMQDNLTAPQYGSVLLVAHHIDATFGNITITSAAQSTFTISGSAGIDGVTMNGLPGNPITSGGGLYSATVTSGWSGTVTPAKTGYTFTPASKVYTNVTANQSSQNYTGTQITFTISGNAGTSGVTMNGLPNNPISDSQGAYSATVTYGWSGTVTPAKTGYTFTPTSKVYTNVTANQTSQNYTAVQGTFTISGSTGIDGVTMNGLPGTPVTSGGGLYSATVSYGWSGTVTPTKTGYTFTPANKVYTNVTADQSGQNYTASQITFTISGTTGIDGVTMNGLPGSPVTSGGGLYSATVPYGWSGTVTPTKTGYSFTPKNKVYTNVTANQSSQNYTGTQATFIISGNAGTSGVTMSGLPGNPISDSLGAYSATVPYGWSGTVKPTKVGYTFKPTSKSYSNVTAHKLSQNYTATQITYTISGNAGTSSVTMNGLPGNPVTGSRGAYSTTVPYGWSGTVKPTKSGYAFTPTSRAYTNVTANKTNQNYTASRVP